MDFETTLDIKIPQNPIDQIIGQEKAKRIALVCAKQRRHLLLIGPPGTGKSLIAQTMANYLPAPTQQINVVHNPENPERPNVEILTKKQAQILKQSQTLASPAQVPAAVAEKLGFRCPFCGALSSPEEDTCPQCNRKKYMTDTDYVSAMETSSGNLLKKKLVYKNKNYERVGEKIRIKTAKDKAKRKTIVPIERNTFIQATGSSETELLGDVKHDPYGDHQELGSEPYTRVVPGAVHEAHEGVLFIDELPSLGYLQRFLLTAMQEKTFPITGKNPNSAGGSIRVDKVPCDFVLVAAVNLSDIEAIIAPLRSRVLGNGYEILLNTVMPDNKKNREQLAQFIAQEIRKDAKIPPMNKQGVKEVIKESKKRAREIDGENGLSLRLRDTGGIVRLAGDIAKSQDAKTITAKHVKQAISEGKSIEDQILERYGSVYDSKGLETYVRTSTNERDVV